MSEAAILPISRAELVRLQRDVLQRELPVRVLTSGLAYLLAMLFVPGSILLACAVVHILAEALCAHAARGLDPDKSPLRRLVLLGSVLVVELAFVTPAAIAFHHPSPYSKALAVGLAASTVMHLSAIRSIDLAQGRAGLIGVTMAATLSLWVFWWQMGMGVVSLPLLISLLCVAGTGGYGFSVLQANHALHLNSLTERQRAEDANAAKTRFLAQMSHELRTPLNAILGLGRAELGRAELGKGGDSLTRERLSVLIASAEGLSALLDDILDTAAMDEGALRLRPVPHPPAEVIRSTAELFRPLIEAAGTSLTVEIAPELSQPAMVDPVRLRQCVTNLLSNAAKVTRGGGIAIRASVAPEAMLRIDLCDSGPGVPAALRDRLFQRHVTQEVVAPDAPGRGRGLGLAISRTLARRMGGDLRLAPSDAGSGGAHFVLTVALPPVAPDAAAPARGQAAPEVVAATPPTSAPEAPRAGLAVLLVDDIATNRMVARHLLEEMGHRVIEAASGPEALDLHGGADLVLMDLNMPGMTGRETLAELRARIGSARPGLPVLALTADAGAEGREAAVAAGFDGFVPKPVDAATLRDEIARALSA